MYATLQETLTIATSAEGNGDVARILKATLMGLQANKLGEFARQAEGFRLLLEEEHTRELRNSGKVIVDEEETRPLTDFLEQESGQVIPIRA
jgi:hypothetical protein